MAAMTSLRVGQGFDAHPWGDDPDRPLVLAGVVFDLPRSLTGHSDADVVAHACADALLGPTGLGDIGAWFPDDDPSFAGADSCELLARVVAAVDDAGWRTVNIDCVVVADAPKLAPRRDEMQTRLSGVVGAPVTIKGKRTEGLGAIDGVACWATALLEQR
jgi:2-C-methyl-D-erythritol 2,4-cyclodiphosphate synthase